MDNAEWSSSTHSKEFPGLAHCKLQSARDKHENRLRVGPLLSRPEPYGLLWGHLTRYKGIHQPLIGKPKDLIIDNIQS